MEAHRGSPGWGLSPNQFHLPAPEHRGSCDPPREPRASAPGARLARERGAQAPPGFSGPRTSRAPWPHFASGPRCCTRPGGTAAPARSCRSAPRARGSVRMARGRSRARSCALAWPPGRSRRGIRRRAELRPQLARDNAEPPAGRPGPQSRSPVSSALTPGSSRRSPRPVSGRCRRGAFHRRWGASSTATSKPRRYASSFCAGLLSTRGFTAPRPTLAAEPAP